jgi:uncharacterized damage-inducible protein DinB
LHLQNSSMSVQPEPWLRGTHTDLPAVIRAVVHALELSRDDVERSCVSLNVEELNARPAGIASVGFHVRHIVRSLDRLLTYAEGRQLNEDQLATMKAEIDSDATPEELLAEFRKGIDGALDRVRALNGADLDQPRAVGRKALPTTVGGLLVHCADHTQRHTGQAVTTARIVQATLP